MFACPLLCLLLVGSCTLVPEVHTVTCHNTSTVFLKLTRCSWYMFGISDEVFNITKVGGVKT